MITYKYSKDTVVNATSCKLITGVFAGTWYSKAVYNSTVAVDRFITYENNRVLYLFNGSRFDTVVNYKASIGDKWLRTGWYGTPRTSVTVSDTLSEVVNGLRLKKIKTTHTYTHSSIPSTATVTVNNTFLERIYNSESNYKRTTNPLFLLYGEHEWNVDEPYYKFVCYRDNAFAQYGSDCYTLPTTENFSEPNAWLIYPNPFRNELILESSSSFPKHNIQITDVFGKEVFRAVLQAPESIGLSDLQPGLYFVTVKNETGIVISQKVIKH